MTAPEPFPDAIDEARRRRFEQAWRDGRPIPIATALEGVDPALRAATLEELALIELEFAHRHGAALADMPGVPYAAPPSVNDLVARVPELAAPGVDARLRAHVAGLGAPDTVPSAPPRRIAGFELVRPLGAGGMGVVHLARQASPRRLVALKLLNPLVVGREAWSRFEHEAQILGRLRHPGIAPVFDAGVHEADGERLPWIAMEHVDGPSLDAWVALARPSRRERLELFIAVCGAVEHAHQRGVVHRDLKPGNILVETTDGRPRPRVLDFGLARLTKGDARSASLRTGTGHLLGTLQYMSPEQTEGRPEAVGAASDVYALGVILHELLAERPPYDLAGRPIADALRAIQTRDPAPLGRVDPALRGDLETIVATALEKDPARRYASAAALAADLHAHLEDRPIAAHPPSTVYQVRKFARRHRVAVAAAATVIVVLLAGTAVATWQAVRATRALAEAEAQRDEAQRQTRIAEGVIEFLTHDLLGAANPYAGDGAGGPEPTVADTLDAAALRVAARFPDEPLVESSVRIVIARGYLGLGRFAPALRELRRAETTLVESVGPDHPQTLAARYGVAEALFEMGRYDEVEPIVEDVIAARSRVLGPEHPSTLEARFGLATLYWFTRRLDEAEAALRAVMTVQRRTLDPRDDALAATTGMLAEVLRAEGRHGEAEPLFVAAVDAWRRPDGTLHPDGFAHLQNLSILYYDLDRLDEAEAAKRELIDAAVATLGADHPETLKYRASLAEVLRRRGRLEEAESIHLDVLAARRRTIGLRHPWTLSSQERLADVYLDQGRLADAEALLADTVAIAREVLDDDFWYRGVFLRKWGHALAALGRTAEAERVLVEARDHLLRTVGAGHAQTGRAEAELAALHAAE